MRKGPSLGQRKAGALLPGLAPISIAGELSGGNVPTIEWERSSLSTATILKYVTDALLDQQKDSFFIDLKKEALSRVLILRRTEENKLDRMGRAIIVWALGTIQERNGNLFSVWPELTKYIDASNNADIDVVERLKASFGAKSTELLEVGAIALDILSGFDNWCEAQRHKKSISIANLSLESREKVLATVTAIYQRFELTSNPKVAITWAHPSVTENYEARTLSLEFLQNKDVVMRYRFQHTGGGSIEVEIDVKEFVRFRDELLVLYVPATDEQAIAADNSTPAVSSNPFDSIADLRWQDITIRFLDGHNIKISAKGISLTVDFKQMGFEDARNRLPNSQWALLKVLAERGGQIHWEDSEASDNIKKKKQLLSDTLKTFFRIDDDPFHPYREEKAYRIKFTLKAEGD